MGLQQIIDEMGELPDDGHDIGSMSPVTHKARDWSVWRKNLTWPSVTHGGTEGLSQAIEQLGLPFARRAARLTTLECTTRLSIVQELTGDPETTGMIFTTQAIAVLSAAKAEIDLDQYVYTDGSSVEIIHGPE